MTVLLDTIQVTAQYSNAVLVAILPYISQFTTDLKIPVPQPIRISEVSNFVPYTTPGDVGGVVTLTNGHMFWFEHGHVQGFRTPRSYFTIQDPNKIPSFYGRSHLNRAQAINLARECIRRLGYKEEMVYADLVPVVQEPPRVAGNTIPRYLISWYAPNREKFVSAEIEVDSENNTIQRLWFLNYNLWRPSPEIDFKPTIIPGTKQLRELESKKKKKIYLKVKDEALELSNKISHFKLPTGTATNDSLEVKVNDRGEIVHCMLKFENGYSFYHDWPGIRGFRAPDVFFTWDHDIDMKSYRGSSKLNERQAIEIAQREVTKIGYSVAELHMSDKPDIQRPFMANRDVIPRLQLQWKKMENGLLISLVRIEIDTSDGVIKALDIYDSNRDAPLNTD